MIIVSVSHDTKIIKIIALIPIIIHAQIFKKAMKTDIIIHKSVNKKKNNPVHTAIIALSHQVSLNSFVDSFIDLNAHFFPVSLSEKQKK